MENNNFSFGEELDKAEKDFDIGKKEIFKFAEGESRIRVLSPGKPLASHFVSAKENHVCFGAEEGCKYHEATSPRPNVKFLMWIIDRKDSAIKLAYMPYTIMKELAALQNNPDYEFNAPPMPYDVTITAKKAGTKDVEYSVIAARKNEELTADEVALYGGKTDVETLITTQKMKEQNQAIPLEE